MFLTNVLLNISMVIVYMLDVTDTIILTFFHILMSGTLGKWTVVHIVLLHA